MARAAIVGALLLFAVLTFVAFLVPLLDCPECEDPEPCLRCGEVRRLTAFHCGLGAKSDPYLAYLVSGEVNTYLAGDDFSYRFSEPEVFRWRAVDDAFSKQTAVSVEVSKVFVWFDWAETDAEAGSPCRVILFDRTGVELDRLEVWLEESPNLSGLMDRDPPVVNLRVTDREPKPSAYFLRRGKEAATRVPQADWPSDWPAAGLGRILFRDGRLQFESP